MLDRIKYEDGVHDITNAEYHASAGISRSKLMLLEKSPYHFWYEVLSGEAERKEPTAAMKIGSLFHTLLLEPQLFMREFCIKPELEKLPPQVLLKDVGREEFEQNKELRKVVSENNSKIMQDFESDAAGKILISQSEFDKVYRMAELVKRHEIVTTLLDEARFEKSIFWTDEETGIQFKTRPDIWASKMVVDLKTTADASIGAFTRSANKYGYYLQAGMAFEACKAIGEPFEMFVDLVCEKEEPFVPAIFMMSDEALQFGIDQFCAYKRKLKTCIDTNKWPGYTVQELGVHKWAIITSDEEE